MIVSRDLVGRLLLLGVVLAAAAILAGAVLYLWHAGAAAASYGAFVGEPGDLRHLGGTMADAGAGSGRGLIQFGLIVLVALQPLRVALTALLFAREQDWLYTGFSLGILAVLLYGLWGA